MELTDQITSIKGIGDKSAKLFHKLGVDTIQDLIHMYPRYYLTYDTPLELKNIVAGERVAVCASISSYIEVKKVRSLTIVTCMVRDSSGVLKLTWFNMPYLKKMFHIGQTYVFVGTITARGSQLVMEHPEYYTQAAYASMMQVRQPVYPLTQGLSNKLVQKVMKQVLPVMDQIADPLPQQVVEENALMQYAEAIRQMHFPESDETLRQAGNRMVFDEFFFYLAAMEQLKKKRNLTVNHNKIAYTEEVDDFIAGLPYTLTGAQKRTIDEIRADMEGDYVMNRLVQGDVGSGKTIVAVIAFLMTVKAGYQCAYMVPTEVLAYQHYESVSKLLMPYGVRVGLLVGSLTAKEKRHVYEDLKHHDLDLVIGTHALIQNQVEYDNLALVVTDEQHRFGVKQRQALSDKGMEPHVMVMSATPIPRTLALILYGDLDISLMDELPADRLPIKNCVVGTKYRPTAYRFIQQEVDASHQAYVICPMVEESESLEVENVVAYSDTLREALSDTVRVEYLHGKMSADEKREIMQRFYDREIDVLVSTTVIEVGIDNPNATVMMIENSERFGLAQLHQLRGRVGRGKDQSYCIFICGKETKEAMERLEVMNQSNDGFYIANEDLRLRGPGDFFGYRQSGESFFELADIYNHADILKQARDALSGLISSGYDLSGLSSEQFRAKLALSMNL